MPCAQSAKGEARRRSQKGLVQDTIFHSNADWKGVCGCTVEGDCAVHILMEGGNDAVQPWWAADILQEAEESTSANQINGLLSGP